MAAPSRRLIYVFRAGNPLMHELAAMEAPRGFQKRVVTIPANLRAGVYESNLKHAFEKAGLAVEDVSHADTHIVVDDDLKEIVEEKFAMAPPVPGHYRYGSSRHVVPVSKAFADTLKYRAYADERDLVIAKPRKFTRLLLRQLGAVIQSIRDEGKEPVLLEDSIAKNDWFGLRSVGDKDLDKWDSLVSRHLRKKFGLRVIRFDDLVSGAEQNDLKNVVALVDHDMATPLANVLGKFKTRLEVAAPCPCHIHRSGEHRERGFKIFETNWTGDPELLGEVNKTIRTSVAYNIEENAWRMEHPEIIAAAKLRQEELGKKEK